MKIQELVLYTSNLLEQFSFYKDILEFHVVEKTEKSISFQVGHSLLTFIESDKATSYHFAINIPKNKINEAYKWLKQRVSLLQEEGRELIFFESWNANALYFYDRDKNIVEFISRNTLEEFSDNNFSTKEILGISEIGIPTNNIEEVYKQIYKIKPIDIYSGSLERFCALGNEEGLFIVINKEIKKWFPSQDVAYASDFKIKGDYNFEYIEGKINKI